MEKATHSFSVERRDCLKPALNKEVQSLCDLEPTYLEIYLEKIWIKFEISQRELETVTEFSKYQIKEQSSRTFIKGRF